MTSTSGAIASVGHFNCIRCSYTACYLKVFNFVCLGYSPPYKICMVLHFTSQSG
ncbi:hypothetical protein H6F74_21870 [Trichocoleus sp. FACHB-90]|uniref:hypothetical protein n=1 Tax=Trichocoleus sp. FACHB-90 TaxID=2692876 RepID=UPI001682C1E4|nr:hypothetical protein [Trichocoleus sp. FACHB-90]MBD1928873.1 hypothetical protein [Trichocoleus sp. FACHB-90]